MWSQSYLNNVIGSLCPRVCGTVIFFSLCCASERVSVIVMCHIDWAKGYPDSWETFLGVSVRVFLEATSILISGLSRGHCHQCRSASSNPLRARIGQNDMRRTNWLLLLKLSHPSSPSFGNQCSSFLGLQILTKTNTISTPTPILRSPGWNELHHGSVLLVLQLADNRSRDFSASLSVWANSYNKFPLSNLCRYPMCSVSLENPE